MKSPPTKKRLIARSLLIAGGLTIFKLVVYGLTNSMAILASAADSLMDFVVSLANYFFVSGASRPADWNHAYGHGKFESLAGLLQSLFIGGVALGVAVGAVRRFYHPQLIEQPWIGIAVMLVALGFNLWHVRNLKKSMVQTESQVMATEYLHFVSDTFAYAGILISFALSRLTGLLWWDPLISLFIVAYLIKGVVEIFRGALSELLDTQLPAAVLKEIDHAIRSYHPQVVDYHGLRTRKVGSTKFIEFHLVLRDVEQFKKAHQLAEQLIKNLRMMYPDSVVTVHTDPEGGYDPASH